MYDKILVPYDGSATSELGLREAIAIARLAAARIRVLHVTDVMSLPLGGEGYVGAIGDLVAALHKAGEAVVEQGRRAVERAGIAVDTVLHEGTGGGVAQFVAEEAARWGADLIVIGTHGRRGVTRWALGSDAEQIARSSTVPVLLVRERHARPVLR